MARNARASGSGVGCWAASIAWTSGIAAAASTTDREVHMWSKGAPFAPSGKAGSFRETRRTYGRRPTAGTTTRRRGTSQRESAVERVRARARFRDRALLPQHAGPALRVLAAGTPARAAEPGAGAGELHRFLDVAH